MAPRNEAALCFGAFELDGRAFTLRRHGAPVKLERRPLELLLLLAERRGQLVSREDIAERLWGAAFHVEIDMGVNTAIRKIRRVLGDDARLIETVPGKGYRLAAEAPAPEAARPEAARPEAARPETARAAVVAVLPFDNLSASAAHDYLAEGFTEETIALLGEIDPLSLCVIGRSSVMAYRGTGAPVAQIAADLGADYLVESSLRHEGTRLRITSRLLRADDQTQMWSGRYDGEDSGVLDLQQALASTIAEQIRLRLAEPAKTVAAARQTRDPEAYDLYLRGRAFWNRSTAPSTQKAIEYFLKAAEIDPDYALAWSGLADAYAGGPIMSDLPARAVWARAREAADRALATNAALAEAQAADGFVKFWLDWDWKAADAAFTNARAANPSFAFAHRMAGICASHQARHDEARRAMRRARELDPLYAMHHALSAQIEIAGRDYETAARFARHATVIDPQFWIGHYQLGQAYVHLRQNDAAFEALNRAGQLAGGNSKTIALQGYLLGRMGRCHEARERVETLLAISRERFVPPYALALIHAGLGDAAAALDWLERAHDAHDVHLAFLPVDPKWDFCQSEPRFCALLQRCGFAVEAQADS